MLTWYSVLSLHFFWAGPTPPVKDEGEKVQAPKLEDNENKDDVITKEIEEEVKDEKEQDTTKTLESKLEESGASKKEIPNKENDKTQAVPVDAPAKANIPPNQGVRPSSRVLAPPGGHCSIKLG
jgi:hypothetical protein